MGLLDKLFGRKPKPEEPQGMDDHLVRLHIPLGSEMGDEQERERWFELEDLLGERVDAAGVGELDGNEVGGNEFTIWFYGPQAVPLAEVIKHALEDHPLPPGSTLFLRHGGVNDPNARQETEALP